MDRGLIQTFSLYSVTGGDSGYGAVSEVETLVKSGIKCRQTSEYLDRNESVQRQAGQDYEKLWKMILDYTPEITYNRHFRLKEPSTGLVFDITWFQHQRNRTGVFHHTSVVAEVNE